jgi:hypothetical protein
MFISSRGETSNSATLVGRREARWFQGVQSVSTVNDGPRGGGSCERY